VNGHIITQPATDCARNSAGGGSCTCWQLSRQPGQSPVMPPYRLARSFSYSSWVPTQNQTISSRDLRTPTAR